MDNIKVHIHDNSRTPVGQNCLGEFKLEPEKIITLHMHNGTCQLCPEGHCHHGSISMLFGANGDLFVVFERSQLPSRISCDDYKPTERITHQ
ncbi:MAG: hypothetical protein ACREAB_07220 [Blastocatellia bacterium]